MALKDKTLAELLDYGRGVQHPTTLEAELLDRLEFILKTKGQFDVPVSRVRLAVLDVPMFENLG